LELRAPPALPGRDGRNKCEIDACADVDLALAEVEADRAAHCVVLVLEHQLEVRTVANPSRLRDTCATRDEERRGIFLTERAEAAELLREPLVDFTEANLGIDLARGRHRARAFGEPHDRAAEGLDERGHDLALDRETSRGGVAAEPIEQRGCGRERL